MADIPEPEGKIPNTDPSLLLPGAPRINKKFLKALMAAFAGVFLFAIVLAYSPSRQGNAKPGSGARAAVETRRPGGLTVTAEDYFPLGEREGPGAAGGPQAQPAAVAANDAYRADYGAYDRRPTVEIRESPVTSRPLAASGSTENPYGYGYDADPSSAPRGREERRPIFYNALPVSLPTADSGRAATDQAYQPNIGGSTMENAYASDYQKQNMNSIKEAFLQNARSQADFSGYLDSMYMPPVDPYHEIKAGTYIPITLVSAVHSDLPGPIEAQVVENVYDTYSGRNVLIPKGARVHGTYSASVAFGQDRVLIAWQRMTLPDGVSVSLQGMQGVDLSGMAGLADKVDHHIAELITALGISTVFDLGRAAVTSAMSTVDFLKDINTILTAQGSATTAANSASQQIVVAYAEKLMNQQPTITVREGTRGNVFVSKDIILPSYGASF
jgi:type IV secretion system protein VirB10